MRDEGCKDLPVAVYLPLFYALGRHDCVWKWYAMGVVLGKIVGLQIFKLCWIKVNHMDESILSELVVSGE